jgi:hypothetical protein
VVDELLNRGTSGESLAILIVSFVQDRGMDFDAIVDSMALELGRSSLPFIRSLTMIYKCRL